MKAAGPVCPCPFENRTRSGAPGETVTVSAERPKLQTDTAEVHESLVAAELTRRRRAHNEQIDQRDRIFAWLARILVWLASIVFWLAST